MLRTAARDLRDQMHRRPAQPRTARPAPAVPAPRAAASTRPAATVSVDVDQAVVDHLRRCWSVLNDQHFDGRLSTPVIELATDLPDDVYGQFAHAGDRSTIRLSRQLLTGEHPDVQAGAEHAAGRLLLVEDTLAHEVCHEAQIEIEQAPETYWHGHGPVFASLANRVGRGVLREIGSGGWEAWGSWPFLQRHPWEYGGVFAAVAGVDNFREA
jgi:hypothetical protein